MTSMMLAVVVLCLAPAQDPQPSQADFEAGMRQVEQRMAEREWDEARRLLDGLLERHARAGYVFLRRPELVECLERCAFMPGYRTPGPQELVSGTLRSYSPSTGLVKLRYERGQFGDFWVQRSDELLWDFDGRLRPGDLLIHPALFSRGCTLTVRGSRYGETHGELPTLAAALGQEALVFSFGKPGVGPTAVPAVAVRLGLEGPELVDHAESPATIGRPFEMELRIGRRDAVALFDGKRVLEAKKDKDLFGQVRLGGIDDIERIELRGVAELSWMRGLQDDRYHEALAAFEEGFDEQATLPEWLRLERPADEALAIELPGPERDGQLELVRQALERVDGESWDEGIAFAEALPAKDTSEVFREYLVALLKRGAGDPDGALRHCERVNELERGFMPGWVLHAAIRADLEGVQEGRAELRDLLVREPTCALLYAELADLELHTDDPGGAARTLREGIRTAGYTVRMDEINALRVKAARGPNWPEVHRWESEHYRVTSDIDEPTCREAAGLLETALEHYASVMAPLPEGGARRFPVFLFSGFRGYEVYVGELLASHAGGTYGLYSPQLKQLLIWNTPRRRDMFETVRHEGLHQYLDRLMENPPLWFNEGLAEYWEEADFTKSRSMQVRLSEERLGILRALRLELTPLEELVRTDRAAFMRKAGLHYPEAGAFIHFLMHGGRRNKRWFEELFEGFTREPDWPPVVERVFEGVDWPALELEFADYLRQRR